MISKDVLGLSRQSRTEEMRRMRSMRELSIIECHTCGYEPEDQDSMPVNRCPRCFASTFRRLPRPGALNLAAN